MKPQFLPPAGLLASAGLGARLYRPTPASGALLVYLHGGGWTIGSLDTHDRGCRRLAAGSGAAVLSLDYRLAPEHPWPASVDDTVVALQLVARASEELDIDGAVGVAGDSAGGTLAALACLRLRDEAPDALPDAQVLLYPNTDLTGAHASMREKATGWGLTAQAVRFFNSQSVPVHARREPGLIHGFVQLDDVSPACARAVDRVAADIRACLPSGTSP